MNHDTQFHMREGDGGDVGRGSGGGEGVERGCCGGQILVQKRPGLANETLEICETLHLVDVNETLIKYSQH